MQRMRSPPLRGLPSQKPNWRACGKVVRQLKPQLGSRVFDSGGVQRRAQISADCWRNSAP